ncbi:MAG: DUF5074 domain-containing protein [Muribaculaceae bacterium]|nr:DUF5074 domain-containing protein [Muribaculaceae bacterium]
MKKSVLSAIVAMAALTALAANSPYIAHVYDFLPAPGQFVNVFPSYSPGYTQDSINAQLENALCGKLGGTVSLGSYGGYIVFGFDHPVINKHGYDVKIYGNAMQSNAVPDQAGGSCEPGIIMVGVDMDGDGVPSDGDKWYEIKGSDYDRCQHGFEVTYYKPDENKERVPHASWRFINDIEYVYWTSNDQNPDSTSGYVWRNTFRNQPYWPLWIEDTVLTFRGTKLPNTSIDMSGGNGNNWFQPFFGEGYVDNLPNGNESGFMIDWAVDEDGNPVTLDHIDFIKVYSAQFDYCGWLGEVSTEVCGAEDLHPDAEPDVPGPGPDDFTFTNGVIFINEDRYGANQGSINFYNYDYDEMEYNVFAMVNPGVKLGVTSQHGQLFGGRLFVVSKQANSSEASGSTVGSRLAVLDAATLKQQGSILRFGATPDSVYDGRAYCAVNNDKGYVSTNAGIFVVDVASLAVSGPIDGTQSSAKGDYNSLYYDQCGDMVRFGQYVFAVQQGKGLHVIDPVTDAVVTTLPFPDIVTVFVTAQGHLFVANNNREVYDFGTGPYEADFTQIDPVTFETLAVHQIDGDKGALCAWGAWHARMLCVDPNAERVYYNHEEYQNFISCYDITTHVLTDHCIDLPDGVEINWDGTHNVQGLYASALSFDPHTGDLVVQTTEAAPMYAYQNFNHNWVLFYDAATLELKRQVRLQDAYWFPAMAVYPDVCDPTIAIGNMTLNKGASQVIDLTDVIQDADNMAALAVTVASSANNAVASAEVSGLNLIIEGLAKGTTEVNVTTDSNGKTASCTFTVTVTSMPGDVNMDGVLSIADVTSLIDVLLGSGLDIYDLAAADVDGNGSVTIADVTKLIDILLTGNH